MSARLWLAACALLMTAFHAGAQEADQKPPFVTTPREVVERMLGLAKVGPNDSLIDLGSGDGRIVIAAARRHGARALGVEIDRGLVDAARANAWFAGVEERALFEHGDALQTSLAGASVITMYLLPSLLEKLQPRLLDEPKPGARIVSHAFRMSGWEPDRTETVTLTVPHEGQGDSSLVYLWVVPAKVRGTWFSAADSRRLWRLDIAQNFQQLEVQAYEGDRPIAVEAATLSGTRISLRIDSLAFEGELRDGRISGIAKWPDGEGRLDFERAKD